MLWDFKPHEWVENTKQLLWRIFLSHHFTKSLQNKNIISKITSLAPLSKSGLFSSSLCFVPGWKNQVKNHIIYHVKHDFSNLGPKVKVSASRLIINFNIVLVDFKRLGNHTSLLNNMRLYLYNDSLKLYIYWVSKVCSRFEVLVCFDDYRK